MDFMRLRNESTLTMLWVEISTENIYRPEYLCRSGCVGVSNVPSTYRGMQSSTAVLHQGNDVGCMPRHHLPRFDESSSLDTCLASGLCAGRAQSTYFYRTEILAYVRSACGDTVPSFGAVNAMTKRKIYKIRCGLRWPPINDNTHNNQPKTGGHNGGGQTSFHPVWNTVGHFTQVWYLSQCSTNFL